MPIRKISTLPDVTDYDFRSSNIPEADDLMQFSILNAGEYNSAKVTFETIRDYISDYTLARVTHPSNIVTGLDYIKFTGHDDHSSLTYTKTTNGTTQVDFTIAGFTGSGLVNANIRGIFVRVYLLSGVSYNGAIQTKMPYSSEWYSISLDSGNPTSGGNEGDIVFIPIVESQHDISFKMYFNATTRVEFEILGAHQLVVTA